MISVKLPDGSAKELSDGASAADLAKSISDGLARVAVAAKVNGAVVDLQRELPDGAEVSILTKKDDEALEVLRHSAAHMMADAILRIFPKAQLRKHYTTRDADDIANLAFIGGKTNRAISDKPPAHRSSTPNCASV